jgi:hypothetical protein
MLRINNFLFYERPNNHNGLSKDIQKNLFTLWSGCRVWSHCHHLRKLPQEALLFVCLLVCLIFLFCYQSFAHGLSVHAVLNPNGTISSDSELLLSMRTSHAPGSKPASKHGYNNSGKKTRTMSAWLLLGSFLS